MNDQDKSKFAELLKAIMTEYDREVGTPTLHLWWNALGRFDYADVRRAFSAWIQNPDSGQFAPKPADIIRMIEGATGDQGMKAWATVNKAIRSMGHYQSVAFDDPIIHRVIDDMGGWVRLASTDTEKDLEFRGHEFVKRYRAQVLAGGPDEYPGYLIGKCEMDNRSSGLHGKETVRLIGDPERVKQVYHSGKQGGRLRVQTVANIGELSRQATKAISGPDE